MLKRCLIKIVLFKQRLLKRARMVKEKEHKHMSRRWRMVCFYSPSVLLICERAAYIDWSLYRNNRSWLLTLTWLNHLLPLLLSFMDTFLSRISTSSPSSPSRYRYCLLMEFVQSLCWKCVREKRAVMTRGHSPNAVALSSQVLVRSFN
jgi:hypothetical protein